MSLPNSGSSAPKGVALRNLRYVSHRPAPQLPIVNAKKSEAIGMRIRRSGATAKVWANCMTMAPEVIKGVFVSRWARSRLTYITIPAIAPAAQAQVIFAIMVLTNTVDRLISLNQKKSVSNVTTVLADTISIRTTMPTTHQPRCLIFNNPAISMLRSFTTRERDGKK